MLDNLVRSTGVVFIFLYHPIGLAYTLCGLTELGLCPPSSFLFLFFPFFLIIYMSIRHRMESARHSNSVGLSSIPFSCHWTLALSKKRN